MITYRLVCGMSALVCVVLFGVFLAAPGAYIAGYGVSPDNSGLFLGQRAAPLFLGLAAVCWLLRGATDPQVKWAVSFAMAIAFVGVAVTGVWDFLQGQASATIILAACGEVAIGAAFLFAARCDA